jgi:hypothetical protein
VRQSSHCLEGRDRAGIAAPESLIRQFTISDAGRLRLSPVHPVRRYLPGSLCDTIGPRIDYLAGGTQTAASWRDTPWQGYRDMYP